jgi:ribosome-binding ATPase YchF (GTP1/OBG family)
MRVSLMLRAALIGFGSSGKTTLFQLMTSARETARAAHGKGETSVGISKVPDARLDRLTAMYNPRKRVPATVEFTDLAAQGAAGGAQALVDVVAYKNADALVHVVRAFDDPTVPRPSGSVDSARDAQAMEDELILADLGVAERRLERLEKDLKKSRTAELERERDVITLCKAALEEGKPLRTLDLKGEDLKRLRGFQFLSAKPLLIVINVDESQLAAGGDAATQIDHAAKAAGLTAFLSHASTPRSPSAADRLEYLRSSRRPMPAFWRSGRRIGPRSRDSRQPDLLGYISRSSPSARTSAAPGRSRATRRRNWPPVKFTATSPVASSVRKSSATTP